MRARSVGSIGRTLQRNASEAEVVVLVVGGVVVVVGALEVVVVDGAVLALSLGTVVVGEPVMAGA
jgi:hypothetical protein